MPHEHVQMIVTNEFRPDPRVLKEAKSLIRNGYSVSILGWDRENSGLPISDSIDGAEIRRVRIPGGKYGTGMSQILGYIGFYVYAVMYCFYHRRRIDIVHAHEADSLPLGVLVKLLLRVPLVVDFHELYSGRKAGSLPWILGHVEHQLLPCSDGFVVVNDQLSEHYRSMLRLGVPVAVLPNYPERDHLDRGRRANGPFTVSFFGNVRNRDEIVTLVQAAEKLGDVHVLIAGHGADAGKVAQYVQGLPYSKYVGPFTYNQLPQLYCQSHLVYAVCTLDRNTESAYPVKMWEGLICGQPVIVSKGSVAEQFLISNGAGVGATGKDLSELVLALKYIRDNYAEMSKNAAKLGLPHTWESIDHELMRIYSSLSPT